MDAPKVKMQSNMKKYKMAGIKLHYFLSSDNSDYLLILNNRNRLNVYRVQPQNINLVSTSQTIKHNPISIICGKKEEIYLLSSSGIFTWYINQKQQLIQDTTMYIVWPEQPIKLIPLERDKFIAVCKKKQQTKYNQFCLFFIQKGCITKSVECPQQFWIDIFLVSNLSKRQSFSILLIPSRSKKYPYLFNLDEVKLWQSNNILERHLNKLTQKEIYQDIVLENVTNFCLSAEQKLVYACDSKQLIVFSIMEDEATKSLFLNVRMKIRPKWQNILFCSCNDYTGSLVYASIERIGQINPAKYYVYPQSVKQKSQNSLIKYVYYNRFGQILLISPYSQQESKIYTSKFKEPS